uniref:CPBP family intramembrane glutamic endopeptidase n=1 Tax=Acetatifactor sp. TaxID=1872090 RepID=UPI0040573E60
MPEKINREKKNGKLKDFIKKNILLFFLFIFVIEVCGGVAAVFLRNVFSKNPGMYYFTEGLVCEYLYAILPLVFMVKWGYIKKSNGKKICFGLLLGAPTILFGAYNLLPLLLVKPMLVKPQWFIIFAVVLCMFGVGLWEEAIMRGVFIPLFCEKWQNKKHCYLRAAFASSLFFGVYHLSSSIAGILVYGNIDKEFFVGNLFQVYYTFCFGMLAAGVTLLTRSIIPMVIWHALWDVTAGIGVGLFGIDTYRGYYAQISQQKVFNTYGILLGYPNGAKMAFVICVLLCAVIGIVFVIRAEKKYCALPVLLMEPAED